MPRGLESLCAARERRVLARDPEGAHALVMICNPVVWRLSEMYNIGALHGK